MAGIAVFKTGASVGNVSGALLAQLIEQGKQRSHALKINPRVCIILVILNVVKPDKSTHSTGL